MKVCLPLQMEGNIDFHILKREEYLKTVVQQVDKKKLYEEMLILREMELSIEGLFKEGLIQGFCHLVTGQEAIYIALKSSIGNSKVIGSYRCHGLAYASGIPVKEIVCEVLGKAEGNCKGKGGSMHLYNETFYGGHGIVGAQVSLGTGIAFALKYQKKESVCFTFYGDGAANQGQVFESFNMAKLWNLPVVFVCENNFYGMWTPEEKVSSYSEYYKRGINIPGLRINGNDLDELLRAFTFAREWSAANGPLIIQIDTYRICGHSCVDKTDFYRQQSEIKEKKKEDSVEKLRKNLLQKYSENEIEKIEKDAKNFIREVCESSLRAENPPLSELYTDIIAE